MPRIQMIRDYNNPDKPYPRVIHITVPNNDLVEEIVFDFIVPGEHDSYIQVKRIPEAEGRNKDGWLVVTNYKTRRDV